MAEEKKPSKENVKVDPKKKVGEEKVEKEDKKKSNNQPMADHKKKAILIGVISGILAVFIVLLIVFTVLYNNNANNQFYQERSDSMLTLTSKVGNVVDSYITNTWNAVDACDNLSQYSTKANGTSFTGPADAADYMTTVAFKDIQNSDGSKYTVYLIDNDAKYYAKAGNGNWANMYMLTSVEKALYVDELASKESMFFVKKLATPITNAFGTTKTISYIVVTLAIDSLSDAFKVDTIEDSNSSFIFTANGEVLSSYYSGSDNILSQNVYETLKDDTSDAEVETIKASLAEGKSVCVEFTQNKEKYFFAASKLAQDDLYVATIVPTSIIAANSDKFSDTSVIFYIEIAVIVAVMIACIIVLLLMAVKDRQMVVQQQEQNVKIEQVVQKAESASNAKIEFLENMSHDIRTPINGILGMTAIALREQNIPAKVEYCLFKIDTASHHLLSIVNDVLDMSHIESGKTEIVHEAMDIRNTINNCVNILQGKMADRSLQFITQFDQFKHPHVYGDELHLRQVLMNILGNAEKFTPDGGKIMFRVKEKYTASNKLVYFFEIEDTGCGMKPEFLAHIFEPFTQETGGARTQYGGTGLGMSITKKYVDMMGGKIAVKSEVGVGTIFTVGIPFDADTSAHADTTNEQFADVVESSPLDGVKVLLVEDNELNREVAQALLQDQGMHVSAAVNGQNAVFLFKNNPPGTYDVILMDIMMPVMDGLEATRQIRAMDRPDAKKIPIIAMTANAFEEDVRKSYDAGMNEHLAKPIILETLIKVLSKFVIK